MKARILAGASLLLFTACAPAVVPRPTPVDDQQRWVEQTLASLSLREKVAQMVVPRVGGEYLPTESDTHDRLRDWIATRGIGGVIIGRGAPLEVAARLNLLQGMAKVPLLVSADMESGPGGILRGGVFLPGGGEVGGATPFPPLMAFGAAGDERLVYEMGRITAREGRAVGVHMTYAPVVDVNNNPNNPIINTRSYGEQPPQAGKLAAAHIRGLQENGMLATAKHFPGHGDTGTDSHIDLPVISVDRARADVVLFSPFVRVLAYKGDVAIAPGVAVFVSRVAARRPTVVTPFGNPYVLSQFPSVGSYLLAWGQQDAAQIAAVRALTGEIPITGKLPISLPPYHTVGTGIQRSALRGATR
jgi:beta-N-acetylhexosaminidase